MESSTIRGPGEKKEGRKRRKKGKHVRIMR
jgi:hypothetical protein